MSRQVWKFPVDLSSAEDIVTVDMPEGAKVLSVLNQREVLCVYALVDPDRPKTERRFRVAGTGHKVAAFVSAKQFVGSAAFAGGSLVLHVFELE